MLKDSLLTRLFIRVAVTGLRSIAPLSILYWCVKLTGWTPQGLDRLPLFAIDFYTTAEALFYLIVYLPRKWLLNRPMPEYLALKTREERRRFWIKTWDAAPDPAGHTSLWFKGAPVDRLHKEEVKDWIVWALWNSTRRNVVDEVELDEYVAYTEQVLQMTFPQGRSEYEPLLITTEPLNMLHRPLLWYMVRDMFFRTDESDADWSEAFVGGVDFPSSLVLMSSGFSLYRLPMASFFAAFPFRPLSLLTQYVSPVDDISYWYREHTSKDRIPVVFIHGIGIGVFPYVSFFREFKQQVGNDVGLIALEIMPVCSRITRPVLPRGEMVSQIQQILRRHGWTRCVLVTHSYGSAIAAQLVHDERTKELIGPQLFVDPVTFSFHAPYIAWNFLRRLPISASEIELHYFASTDPDVNHALTRSFVWPEVTLWRDDIESAGRVKNQRVGRNTVALAGMDIITNTQIVGDYLTRLEGESTKWYHQDCRSFEAWKTKAWTGKEAIEVIWFPSCNHAEVFDDRRDRRKLLQVIDNYTKYGGIA